ncbi:12891_t:CDS:2 [Acaulospora morrowiae]|uniref:12891_t:CDS:1 n=1 Tax=Acaulospora morrowiae TaxID=94023 RepID=A0A9N9E6Q4_9GLOM|nr:12891_t:CDS:2 [Acaulospora morrowiae]
MGNRLSNPGNGPRRIRDYVIDEGEIDRLQVQHHIFRTLWEGNFKAPVEEILNSGNARVLDVGCGTGTWACDVISDFPMCHITGIDRSELLFPYQPPQNVRFQCVDSYLKGLSAFNDNSFDYLHMRLCWSHFTRDQWRNTILLELARVIKPGGWLEIVDFSVDAQNMGPATAQFVQTILEQSRLQNLDHQIIPSLPNLLRSIPSLSPQVHHQIRLLPCGSWDVGLGTCYENISRSTLSKSIENLPPEKAQEYREMFENILEEIRLYRTSAICHRIFVQKGTNNSSNIAV